MVKLAESSQAQKTGANENKPLEVSIASDGNVFATNVNGADHDWRHCRAELRDSPSPKNPDVTLAINADANAPWGKVVKVRDAAAEAKIKKLIANTKQTPKP